MERRETERPPSANTPQGYQIPQSRPWIVSFEIWKVYNPCPEGVSDCPRCGIDYATYLAYEELLNADAPSMGGLYPEWAAGDERELYHSDRSFSGYGNRSEQDGDEDPPWS